jgi:putative membrane protein
MGVADLIPGVSGGTIAFVAGIYTDLLAAIQAFDRHFFAELFRFRLRAAFERVPWRFLILLLGGIATAIATLSHLFRWALAEHQAVVFAFFLGLVAASIVAVGGTVRWRWAPLAAGVAGGVAGLIVVGLVPAVMPHDPLTLFWSGAVAIVAMILPGISGSFVLLLLGQYEFLLGAVATLDLGSILAAAAGGVAGLAVFARLLGWLLAAHREVTVAALVGVMAGSLRRLWPLDAHTGVGDAVILAAVAGAGFAALTLFDHWRTGANPLARALGWRAGVRG